MKKTLIISIIFFLFTISIAHSSAQTATPQTATKSAQESDEESKVFIDKLASKVAQLNLVEKRGIIGTVVNTSDLQFTINDHNKEAYIIDVDELTKFASASGKVDSSFGISDLTKGDTVGILGLYNKQSRRTLARFVDLLALPKVFTGAITEVNNEDYTITVTANDNATYIVDIETSTKSSSYTKAGGLIKSGFSQYAPGQHVLVRGFPNKSSAKRISATRIVIFPELAVNPQLKSAVTESQTNTAKITPTASSSQ